MRRLIVTLFAIFALLAPYSSFSATNTEGERGKPSGKDIGGVYASYLPSKIIKAWKESRIAAENMQAQELEAKKQNLPENLSEEEYQKRTKTKSRFRCRMIVIFNQTEFLDSSYRVTIALSFYFLLAIIIFAFLTRLLFVKNSTFSREMSFDNDGVIFKNKE